VKDSTKTIHGDAESDGGYCHLWGTTFQEWTMDERGVIYSTRNPSRCIHLKSGTQPTYNGDGVHMWGVQQGEFPAQEWVIVPVEHVQWQPKE